MSDFIVKLDPEDEFNHIPDSSSNYNESMYFNVFDHGKKMGGWFRLGNRPNEGYAEMTVVFTFRMEELVLCLVDQE